MNFAREIKNNVRKPYQVTTIETHDFKLHISKGNGPNHTLQQLIPHTIIPYKAPCEMIKNNFINTYVQVQRSVKQNVAKRAAKLNFFACVA